MVKMPILTAEATKAFARLVLGGVRCDPRDGFEKYLNARSDVSLEELGSFFDSSSGITPVTFLASYAINQQISQPLTPTDIARAYSVNHIPIVRAIARAFEKNGLDDERFSKMRQRGFQLKTQRELYQYLFSCIGEVGEVMQVAKEENRLKRLRVFCRYRDWRIEVTNVCTLQDVKRGEYIVMHFASAFTKIPKNEGLNIIRKQLSDEWFPGLVQEVRELDYTDWLGQDLAAWTEERLTVN